MNWQLDAPVLAALLGGLVAQAGAVVITAWNAWLARQRRISDEKQAADLAKRTADQAEKAAKSQMQKEIFIPFWEDLANLLDFIARMSIIPYDDVVQMEPLKKFAAHTTKILAVSPQELSEPLNEAAIQLEGIASQLSSSRLRLEKTATMLERKDSHIQTLHEGRLQLEAQFEALKEKKATVDQLHAASLEIEVRKYYIMGLVDEAIKERDKVLKMRFAMSEEMFSLIDQWEPYQIAMLQAIRLHLGIAPLDENRLRRANELNKIQARKFAEQAQKAAVSIRDNN